MLTDSDVIGVGGFIVIFALGLFSWLAQGPF